MGSNFFSTTIGEQITLQRGFDITKKEQQEGNVPVVSSGGISSYHNVSKVEAPGVVLGRKGTLGTVFFVEKDFWPHDTSLWVKDFKGNNPQFVYYFFKGMSAELKKMDVGAANPALNRNHVHPLQVEWPRREVQDQIVSVGAALDQKITLNNQINQTLEQMAQTLFKSWLVDFDPVKAKMNGEQPKGMDAPFLSKEVASLFPEKLVESELGLIPEGWEVLESQKVATVAIGKTPPRKEPQWFSENPSNVTWVSIKDMGNAGTYALDSSEYLTPEAVDKFNVKVIPDNTLILSFKLTVGRVAITHGEMTTNEAIAHYKLTDDARVSTNFLYSYMKQFNFESLGSTSSIAKAVNSRIIKALPVIVPSKEILDSFDTLVKPLFDKIKSNQMENQNLEALRDTLLPKLLSGEIDLENLQVEQAIAIAE
ncbi:restriction endonuclease subunit S [Vibrio celticus]|uniref:EcoKI restriction-modification system protein HsdS n=1 Tax=Vibrio celticus TaxID=446372 RepID=A0A1C3J8H5_9VIBR|nr:restriction endonuclease subunit S [Vibrio celticus]SBT11356.1 EcoKI restriction-modification system protein HsdS [Vibrio celticus]